MHSYLQEKLFMAIYQLLGEGDFTLGPSLENFLRVNDTLGEILFIYTHTTPSNKKMKRALARFISRYPIPSTPQQAAPRVPTAEAFGLALAPGAPAGAPLL